MSFDQNRRGGGGVRPLSDRGLAYAMTMRVAPVPLGLLRSVAARSVNPRRAPQVSFQSGWGEPHRQARTFSVAIALIQQGVSQALENWRPCTKRNCSDKYKEGPRSTYGAASVGPEPVAFVELLEPECALRTLRVERPEYLHRESLRVCNTEKLMQEAENPNVRRMWRNSDRYQSAALRAILSEINHVCEELRLAENVFGDAVVGACEFVGGRAAVVDGWVCGGVGERGVFDGISARWGELPREPLSSSPS